MKRLFFSISVGLPVVFGLLWAAGIVRPEISVEITPRGATEVEVIRFSDGREVAEVIVLHEAKHLTARAGEVVEVRVRGGSGEIQLSAEAGRLIRMVRVTGTGSQVRLLTSPSLRVQAGTRVSSRRTECLTSA